ncbi:hypothetical protein JRQ81_000426 [Phrynocephalus forsythii]|uniref:BMERB domain-containing protein n=1 Tax=Phrynocephalus forsythii TaxID=171643 RepID=A0A9Q1B802_9SAUR|nr:hypothetical protein JRQ81_000426 [Phrynocephalus forsythii]
MTEHNLLAVRVMVTSDGSSSELEPDFHGDSAIAERNRGPLPELRSSNLSSRAPLLLNASSRKRDEESKAMHALQRAYSLRDTSTSRKYQHWKKKIQSNFPLLYSKMHSPSLRDASTSFHGDAVVDDVLEKELISPSDVPGIARGHCENHRPAFHMKRKGPDLPGEIPVYIPHYSLHNDRDPLTYSKSFCHRDQMLRCPPGFGIKDRSTKEGQHLRNQGVNIKQPISEVFAKDPDTSSVSLEVGEPTSLLSAREWDNSHLNKAKHKIMRKLTLSMEQQSKLLAMTGAEPEERSLEEQGRETIPGHLGAYFNRYEKIPKQSSGDSSPMVSDKHCLILFPEHKHPKNVDHCPKESSTNQPTSPLRLIASAIKKSILEPFISSPENVKKSHNNAKIPSESTFFKFSHTPTDSVTVKSSRDGADCDVQTQELHVLRQAGKRHGIRSSDISNFVSNPKEEYSWDAFPVYSVHTSHTNISKHLDEPKHASYTDAEDVPALLEKFTLKENLWRSAKDDWHTHNQKNVLYPSLSYRKKTADATSDRSVRRNNAWNLFGSISSKGDVKVKAPSSGPLVSPCTIFDVDKVLNNSSKGESLGPEHLPVYRSSSSDDELEYKPSIPPMAKRSHRRSRKLEKETKQLIKQEELKRLHKAQAIQRLLEEVEEKQKAVEVRGVQLERELRGELDSSTQDDTQLLQEWFHLVLEKNKLMRYELELLNIAKELESDDHQNSERS